MATKRQMRSMKILRNARKQRGKYPEILNKVIEISDIILEVLDARFPKEMLNKDIENLIKKKDKKIIYVLNKSDLTQKRELSLNPKIFVSCKNRKGISKLRNKIKEMATKIKRIGDYNRIHVGVPQEGTRTPHRYERIHVGVIGYPNTGKSSLINLLIGKASAKTGSEAGFTKGIQKLKLAEGIILLDSPGVIPFDEYSMNDDEKIAQQVKVGGKSHSQVKNPEFALNEIVKTNKKSLEKFYKIKFSDTEDLIEVLGKKKGFLKKKGEINSDRTAREILKDWQVGKIKI